MFGFIELEEINILIYLYSDTKTFAKLGLLNKYNRDLFNKLINDKQFYNRNY